MIRENLPAVATFGRQVCGIRGFPYTFIRHYVIGKCRKVNLVVNQTAGKGGLSKEIKSLQKKGKEDQVFLPLIINIKQVNKY